MHKLQNVRSTMLVVTIAALTACAASSTQKQATADRMYVLYCGEGSAPDQSRWSPGVNVGKPITLTNSCYLIRHGNDWLLWETGYAESIAGKPDGFPTQVLHWRWTAP